LRPGGTLIYDKDLVVIDDKLHPKDIRKHGIDATDIAHKKFGRKIVANMVLLGYMNALLKIVPVSALEKAVAENVPKGTDQLNLDAMRKGIELARKESKTKTEATE